MHVVLAHMAFNASSPANCTSTSVGNVFIFQVTNSTVFCFEKSLPISTFEALMSRMHSNVAMEASRSASLRKTWATHCVAFNSAPIFVYFATRPNPRIAVPRIAAFPSVPASLLATVAIVETNELATPLSVNNALFSLTEAKFDTTSMVMRMAFVSVMSLVAMACNVVMCDFACSFVTHFDKRSEQIALLWTPTASFGFKWGITAMITSEQFCLVNASWSFSLPLETRCNTVNAMEMQSM